MKKLTQEQLKVVLDKHKKWLNREEGGEYADLEDADLRQADLRDADLRQADLRGTDFSQANTIKVNGFYSVDNIGSFEGRVTYCKFNNTIYAGCWSGGLDDFLERGLEMNARNEVEMENIKMCYDFFKRME